MPHVFVSAGDISGDQHAARLVTALHARVDGVTVEGLGGPRLADAGVALHADLVSQAIMGFGAALAALPEMIGLLRRVAGVFDARRPDVVVLVDYPGLNLFVARLARARGIPVVYFVLPQLWAWAPWRVRRFARVVDEGLVIFPFEVGFFRDAGIDTTYVGHPLLDALPTEPPVRDEIASRPRPIALLPGSRPREVRVNMPWMLAAAKVLAARHPDVSFHTAHTSPDRRAQMAELANDAAVELHVHDDDVHGVMASCRAAAVASGTATYETALFGTPMVVVYRITPTERRLGNLLLVPEHVGVVNLVAGEGLCPEVLRVEPDVGALVAELEPLLTDTPTYRAQREGLERLAARSPGPGAVDRAADRIAARLAVR